MVSWRGIRGNSEAYGRLKTLVASKTAVAFVGSGASSPLYPLWGELLDLLAEKAFTVGKANRKELEDWCRRPRSDPLETASEVCARLGRGAYANLIFETFKPQSGDDGKGYTPVHAALLSLPFGAYVTTNYDIGLSEARADQGRGSQPSPFTWQGDDVPRWLTGQVFDADTVPILHAHGLYNDSKSLVLTWEEYRRAYAPGPYRQLFEQLWIKGSMVFVGFSFTDPWIKYVVDKVLDKTRIPTITGPGHVAVIGLEDKKLGVPDLYRGRLERLHAQALVYRIGRREDGRQDHSELLEILAELETSERPPAPPVIPQIAGAAGERDVLTQWFEQVSKKYRWLRVRFDGTAEYRELETAWVRLELTLAEDIEGGDRSATGEKTQLVDGPFRPRTLEELLDLDPRQHAWVTNRWLVEGEPGSGKTTLLRRLAGRLAEQCDPDRIPVLVSLPELVDPVRSVLDYLDQEMGSLCGPNLRAVLDAAGRNGRLQVLIDGLDEVPPKHRERVWDVLVTLEREWSDSRVVLTSRPIGRGQLPPRYQRLLLQPFDDDQRQHFLDKWFDRSPAEVAAARAHFDAWPNLRELSHNPLHLTLLAALWQEQAGEPIRRSEIYEEVFKLLLEGLHRNSKAIAATADVRAALRHLAFELIRDGRSAEEPDTLEQRLRSAQLDDVRGRLEGVWGQELRTFLDAVHERTYLLGPHDGPKAPWRFWYRTFGEALAAEKLKEIWERDEQKLLEELKAPESAETQGAIARVVAFLSGRSAPSHGRQHPDRDPSPRGQSRSFLGLEQGDEARWAEPFALLAGHLADPDDLVRSLVAVNRPLGLCALATAQSLGAETLREILDLSDNWQERSQVYEQIPGLIDEPDRALKLLETLRRQTRNGNDLFFLERAMAAVGGRWPDCRQAAEDARRCLFDHIPGPPEDAFRRIETRDGQIRLWRRIECGTVSIGSSEPRHTITIQQPFRLGAVPVTVAQYHLFDPEHESEAEPHHPVAKVSWYAAYAFCRWLSTVLSQARGARLPTEEEWEYACRAGTTSRYWSGNSEADLRRVGWFADNSEDRTHRVGRKPCSDYGLYDMHGNVWEWTLSKWIVAYDHAAIRTVIDPSTVDPQKYAASATSRRVARGGGCWSCGSVARSDYRNHGDPRLEHGDQGFRVLLPVADM